MPPPDLHPTQPSRPVRALLATCLFLGTAGAADVTSFTLIDADADAPIAGYDPIPAGAQLSLGSLPSPRINVRANVSGAVGSVRFAWSGAESGTLVESTAPYAMKGDSNGNYNAWTPAAGSYSLTGTPYTGAAAGGSVAGAARTLAFSVVAGGSGGGGGTNGDGTVVIGGDLRRWHAVTLTLDGPWAAEGGTPNPFLDYRMDVTFTNGALSYVVPGYFAADGNAGESSATSGAKWRAHLSPDLTGTWSYAVSFRSGTDVAVNGGGSTLAPFNGRTGSFTVAESDKSGRDFRGKGRLRYVGQRYLRHAGSNEPFIKVGADSPENMLGYSDFDGSYDHAGGSLKSWSPHVGDWQTGDPTWKGGKGKGLIGAVNYLANEDCNVFSFLTYNAGGDGKDVWPFTAHDAKTRYDCSKLDQWEKLFAHADRKGMFLHFKTQETENDNESPWALDGGNLGRERKLYYRELIARFAHHLGLNWNLGEETTLTTGQQQAAAQYLQDTDPYDHLVVLHTYPGQQEAVYRPLLGGGSRLTGVSIQIGWDQVHREVLQWINESSAAGKTWVVANDEQGGANIGVPPDPGWPGWTPSGPSQDQVRATTLWGALMAGGAGVESYFGYSTVETDLTLQNFRSRDRWWDYCRHAKAFFVQHLPFAAMASANGLVGNGTNDNSRYCMAQAGQVYAVYLASGGTTSLNLAGVSGTFEVRWFDPRNGGGLQTGSVATVTGGGSVGLGNAPGATGSDWAVLVRRIGTGNQPPAASAGPDRSVIDSDGSGAENVPLDGSSSSDSDGSIVSWVWRENGAQIASGATASANLAVGSHSIVLTVTDNAGAVSSDTVVVTVQAGGGGQVVYALNAGGPAVTTSSGIAYRADTGASGGSTMSVATAIAGTVDDALYQSERWGAFSYAVPLANGDYTLVLQFAEIYFTANGQRVFDASAEGVVVADNLDLHARVGSHAAYDVRVPVRISDGVLNLAFQASVNNAKLSAFRVERAAPPAAFTLTLIDADSDQPIAGFAPLADGAVIDLSALPSPRISLRADTATSGSVRFTWSGPESGTQLENSAPYAVKGDTAGDYNPWTPAPGAYVWQAEAFTLDNAGGTSLGTVRLNVTVVDPQPAAPTGSG